MLCMLDLTANTASTMSVVSLPAHSCSRLCTVRQLSGHQRSHNAVRSAFERQARHFCSDHSTPKARATVSAAGIGGNMLAGIKKAFSKVDSSPQSNCVLQGTTTETHLATGTDGVSPTKWRRLLHGQRLFLGRTTSQSPAATEGAAVGDARPRKCMQLLLGRIVFRALSSFSLIDCVIAFIQGPANSRSLKRTFGKGNKPALKLYRYHHFDFAAP